ncbi:conserved domain protein [Actinomyces sp. oral taxon 170 str. F0386]|nr:conserved domain protein [Actinomyces sp. oral taxon 170 str. F0386]
MESRAPSHLRRRRHCSGAPLGLATVRTDGPIDRRRRAEPPLTP